MPESQSINKRYFEYGFATNYLSSGKMNTIADVPGVSVGHLTKIEGEDVRTGVTIIDPGINNLFREKIPGAFYVANGSGKVAGITQVEELGTIETPIALTNTLAVGSVIRGIIDLVIDQTPDLNPIESINAVVGEVNDGFLNNLHKNSIQPSDVSLAYQARSKIVTVGNVGAGTGTRCFSWKGGIGSASRIVRFKNTNYTVGILSQTNFGGSLYLQGIPMGKILGKSDFVIENKIPDGSCVMIIATDAPLTARQLKRMAKRAPLGMARTGSIIATQSGDYVIAFSTNRAGIEGSQITQRLISDLELNNFFLAVVEGVQESIYDALFATKTMTGLNGNIREAFPISQALKYINNNYESK